MEKEDLQDSLIELVEPFVSEQGINLVDLQVSGSGRQRMLRLFVDRPGGVTIDECARVSRSVADLLDTHDPIQGSYVLQVSSPGLTRPLKTERDFTHAVGRTVRLLLDGGIEYVGTLEACRQQQLLITQDGEGITVDLPDVRKANLHF